VWNEEGSALDFVIPPAWYQTNWFRALCVLAFLALLWALYQLRLRQLARQFNMRMEERVGERTRIARDLHDTLLQSFHGLVFRFQAARNMLPNRPEEGTQALDAALIRAEQALDESRHSIQELRRGLSAESDLDQMLIATGQELASSPKRRQPAAIQSHCEGERRRRLLVQEEFSPRQNSQCLSACSHTEEVRSVMTRRFPHDCT
jgi:signal transduction histidine kinase